jgi:hypothetical protein
VSAAALLMVFIEIEFFRLMSSNVSFVSWAFGYPDFLSFAKIPASH